MSKPMDEGIAYCDAQPDLLVAAVWHEAMLHYQNREEQAQFVNGYIMARRTLDEHRKEVADEGPQD